MRCADCGSDKAGAWVTFSPGEVQARYSMPGGAKSPSAKGSQLMEILPVHHFYGACCLVACANRDPKHVRSMRPESSFPFPPLHLADIARGLSQSSCSAERKQECRDFNADMFRVYRVQQAILKCRLNIYSKHLAIQPMPFYALVEN